MINFILSFIETAPGLVMMIFGLFVVFLGLGFLLSFSTAFHIMIVILGTAIFGLGLIIWGGENGGGMA